MLQATCQNKNFIRFEDVRQHMQNRATPYLSVFSPNTGKYGPEITPYLDTFHAV